MSRLRGILDLLGIVTLLLVLVACGGGGGAPAAVDTGLDTDGDGITDFQEINTHGTSPVLPDTDGDGFSDHEEIIIKQFNPILNNLSFNPLIADVPKLSIELTSVPDIQLFVVDSLSNVTTIGTNRENSVATIGTNSTTQTNSTAIEQSHSVGGTTEVGSSIFGPTTNTSVSYDYTHSTTKETSTAWSQTQSQENRTTLSTAETLAQEVGKSITGGSLRYTLTVKNDGIIAFTLTDLILTAVMSDPFDPSAFAPIGNLTLENVLGFPTTTLQTGDSFTELTFSNDILNVPTTKKLLGDSSGLVTKLGIYDVLDENGKSFKHNDTNISALTATVLVDFGTELEQYLVATNGDANNPGITLGSVMRDVLRIPYETDSSGALIEVRGKATLPLINSSWMVVLLSEQVTANGIEQTGEVFDSTQIYGFDGLVINARQVLHLVYLEDADGDGLGIREEIFYGTDPNLADTDADGLSDFEEVKTGWINGFDNTQIFSSPINADIDGDGLNDLEEKLLVSDPRNIDTDGDLTLDGEEAILTGRHPAVFDPKFDFTLSHFVFTQSCDVFTVTFMDFFAESIYSVRITANLTPGTGSIFRIRSNFTPQSISINTPRFVNQLILTTNFIDPLGTFTMTGMFGDFDTSILTADELRLNKTFNISEFPIGTSSRTEFGATTSPFASYDWPCSGFLVLTVDRE